MIPDAVKRKGRYFASRRSLVPAKHAREQLAGAPKALLSGLFRVHVETVLWYLR